MMPQTLSPRYLTHERSYETECCLSSSYRLRRSREFLEQDPHSHVRLRTVSQKIAGTVKIHVRASGEAVRRLRGIAGSVEDVIAPVENVELGSRWLVVERCRRRGHQTVGPGMKSGSPYALSAAGLDAVSL